MVNLLYTEILKLKRSYMLIITLAGASVAPFINLLMFIAIRSYELDREVEVVVDFATYADQTNLFVVLIIGIMLYGIFAAYVFSREYQEDTLKSLLTIPVNRTMLILSKSLLIFLWIQVLTLYTIALQLVFSWLGGFGLITWNSLWATIQTYVLTGTLMFLLVLPVVLLTLVFKSYVVSMVFTIGVVIVNLVLVNTQHQAIYPWLAPLRLVNPLIEIQKYPPSYSWAVIIFTGLGSLLSAIIYFNKQDIH